jgi:hypothetical protein
MSGTGNPNKTGGDEACLIPPAWTPPNRVTETVLNAI